MVGQNLKYILGLLNSKLIDWYFAQISYSLGIEGKRHIKQFVELIPIPPIILQNKPFVQKIEHLVNQILSLTQSEDYLENPQKQAEVKEYERQIGQLVYKLYDLTEEEIKIIEEEIK